MCKRNERESYAASFLNKSIKAQLEDIRGKKNGGGGNVNGSLWQWDFSIPDRSFSLYVTESGDIYTRDILSKEHQEISKEKNTLVGSVLFLPLLGHWQHKSWITDVEETNIYVVQAKENTGSTILHGYAWFYKDNLST